MSAIYVNVDCAHIYQEEKYQSAIVSQAVLWEQVKIITAGQQFSKVICEDGYEGWINNQQICTLEQKPELKIVSKILTNVYEEANSLTHIVRNAGCGCYLPVISERKGWYETYLPDGKKGWIKDSAFSDYNGRPRETLLAITADFLGIPYAWGGKTARGLDCSGYVQLLHKMVGINIRRDSIMQFDDAKLVGENLLDGQAGDLLFFAEDGHRITHVALKLQNNNIIHARGMVKINSLEKNNPLYDESLIKDFMAVKTFL